MKRAFITGITGQDGSYLAELLLEKGYEVHGLLRRGRKVESGCAGRLIVKPEQLGRSLFLHHAELDELDELRELLRTEPPAEIYHLAGPSHVGQSFETPVATTEATAMGTLRLLKLVTDLPVPPRFYNASSSEVFGRPSVTPQNEETPFAPVTPYGCAKAFVTQMVRVYRESFGLFAVNGITYNHESPRRGENFVTRKICRGAAAIKLGLQKELLLGDLSAERDWGYAPDFVRGMWLSLQQETPEDFVFATGELRSVQELVETAFKSVGLNWRDHVRQDQQLMRPAEPVNLLGDASKAARLLGWRNLKPFSEMIAEMTDAELAALKR